MYMLKKQINTYNDPNFDFMIKFIKKCDLFTNLSEETLRELCYGFKFDFVEMDRYIFHFGDERRVIYFLLSGSVEISTPIKQGRIMIEKLYRGCNIGAYSCLVG